MPFRERKSMIETLGESIWPASRWMGDTPLILMIKVTDIVVRVVYWPPILWDILEVVGCLYMHICMSSPRDPRVNQS